MEFTLKPFLKGTASMVLPALRTVRSDVPNFSSADPEFCYSLFLRHYSHAEPYLKNGIPEVVAELGPGGSLGMGICALIFGAKIYYALDYVDHTDPARNLRVFDELLKMVAESRPVPRHSSTFPEPTDWGFPSRLKVVNQDRLAEIREDLAERGDRFLRLAIPWSKSTIPPDTVGWLWSHSVMEHIDEIEGAWKACASWIGPDGIITHEIDYRSHGLTRHWNGHWAMGDLWWRLMRGKRPYLINRMPHSGQMQLALGAGLEVVSELVHTPPDPGLPVHRFSPRFAAGTTHQDRATGMAFVVLRRPDSASSRIGRTPR